MATGTKQAALRIIRQLPDKTSLEDIMYELYVRNALIAGYVNWPQGGPFLTQR